MTTEDRAKRRPNTIELEVNELGIGTLLLNGRPIEDMVKAVTIEVVAHELATVTIALRGGYSLKAKLAAELRVCLPESAPEE